MKSSRSLLFVPIVDRYFDLDNIVLKILLCMVDFFGNAKTTFDSCEMGCNRRSPKSVYLNGTLLPLGLM